LQAIIALHVINFFCVHFGLRGDYAFTHLIELNCQVHSMVSPINEYALEDNTVFSIEGKGLKLNTAEDVQAFVDTIVQMDDLQIIKLSGNTIGVEAGKALASALQSRKNIKVYKYTSRLSFSSLCIHYLPSCL
jgi:hypothetical protein